MLKMLGSMVLAMGLALTGACGMMGGGDRASGGGTKSGTGASSGSSAGTPARCEGLTGQALERCRAQGAGASGSTGRTY